MSDDRTEQKIDKLTDLINDLIREVAVGEERLENRVTEVQLEKKINAIKEILRSEFYGVKDEMYAKLADAVKELQKSDTKTNDNLTTIKVELAKTSTKTAFWTSLITAIITGIIITVATSGI